MFRRKQALLLEDEFTRTLVKGALKSLKWVSIMKMELKFAAIVTALEEYVNEQERKIEEKKNREKQVQNPMGYERQDQFGQPGMPYGYQR